MKRVTGMIVFTLATCMLVAVVSAGGTPKTDDGTAELVFMFDGLSDLDLRPVAGGIDIRYYFRDGMAIRSGLGFAYDAVTNTSQNMFYYDEEFDQFEIGLSVFIEKHFPTIHSITPYCGLGTRVSRASQDWKKPSYRPSGEQEREKMAIWVFESSGTAGFQWFFTEGMSLGGEYRISLSWEYLTAEETDSAGDTETTGESKSHSLGFNTASMFLSVRLR